AARRLVSVRTRHRELRLRDRAGVPRASRRACLLHPRRRDWVVSRLRRRALPARRARGRRSRGGDRYSSSLAVSKPAPITASQASRLIQIPIPRPLAGRNSSGIEIKRIRTKIVESDPSAITTRLSGMVGGSSIPASRSATSAITARPMKKTSFPSVPVCQPITAIVGPTAPEPAYQSVKTEMLRTRPEIQVARSPTAVAPLAGPPSRASGPRAGDLRRREEGVPHSPCWKYVHLRGLIPVLPIEGLG